MMTFPESTAVQKQILLSTLFGFAEAEEKGWKAAFPQTALS